MVAGDRDGVVVAHAAIDERLLDVAHEAERELGREDAGVLGLVLLEDVGLHGAADGAERLGLDAVVVVCAEQSPPDEVGAGDAEHPEAEAVVPGGHRLRRAGRSEGDVGRAVIPEPSRDVGVDGLPPFRLAEVLLDLLVDGRVHEQGEQHRRRAVDRHRDGRRGRAEVEAE